MDRVKRFAPFVPLAGDLLVVPTRVQELKIQDLLISVRLQHVLERREFTQLGDLNGVSVKELSGVGNCGKATIAELIRLIAKAAEGGFKRVAESKAVWAPMELIALLDDVVAELPGRDAKTLNLRLGGQSGQSLTLQGVGDKFKLTRERIRQVIRKTATRLRKAGGPKLKAHLCLVEQACHKLVCPLTPELLEHWLGDKGTSLRFSPAFYVRLMHELCPTITAWPSGQQPSVNRGKRAKTIEHALELALQQRLGPIPLPEAMAMLQAKLRGLEAGEYLEVLRRSRLLRVDFPQPDRPSVRLAHYRAADLARLVLQTSSGPLTPEEIVARTRTHFGDHGPKLNIRTLLNVLTQDERFQHVGPGVYGLRQRIAPAKLANGKSKR